MARQRISYLSYYWDLSFNIGKTHVYIHLYVIIHIYLFIWLYQFSLPLGSHPTQNETFCRQLTINIITNGVILYYYISL